MENLNKNLYSSKYSDQVASSRGYTGFKNRFRTALCLKLIDPQTHESILEIGCNEGALVKDISGRCKEVFGVDITDAVLKCEPKRQYCLMSATNLGFPSSYFDKVCSFEVIEHIENIRSVFIETNRILKPNGSFIISFPFEIFRGQQAILDAIKVYKNPLYARKLHLHLLTPSKIKRIIKGLDYSIEKAFLKFIPSPSFIMFLRKGKN